MNYPQEHIVSTPLRPYVPSAEREARLAWNYLAEGEDQLAWVLVQALGAGAALDLVAGAHVAHITSALRDALMSLCPNPEVMHEVSITHDKVRDRAERWVARLRTFNSEAIWRGADACGARLIIPSDPGWSPLLADLGTRAPLALWVIGRAEPADVTRSVAMVGSRASTHYGDDVARELAVGLVERGWSVISGGAYGIDAMAHRGALAAAPGQFGDATPDELELVPTVAVLAGGVDKVYPKGNFDLLQRVAQHGGLFAETPLSGEPMRHRFLKRNRLIAALSRATVVVEAGHRSGALATARHALDLMRPVGAVPGPVTSLSSVGCHQLMRDGSATCVTTAAEVTELVQLQPELLSRAEVLRQAEVFEPARGREADQPSRSAAVARSRWDSLDDVELRIVDRLSSRSYRKVKGLAAATGHSEMEVAGVLARLEMRDDVIQLNGAFRRAKAFDER